MGFDRFNPFAKGTLYRIGAELLGTGYYNGYNSNGRAHETNGETPVNHYLRDWNNAKRFNPGINPVRQKFQGYVNFHFNSGVQIDALNSTDTMNQLSSMCRTADVPSAEIQTDVKNKKFKFVRVPKFDEVPYPIVMEPNLVIEYYSR